MLRVGLFIVKLYANLFYIKCQRRKHTHTHIHTGGAIPLSVSGEGDIWTLVSEKIAHFQRDTDKENENNEKKSCDFEVVSAKMRKSVDWTNN